ncbi:MAG: glycosyltransferase family 2 protein [Bdellovibrionales bacterium]|nr:glycosyltransferase family 2 protein [Massilia sp.]
MPRVTVVMPTFEQSHFIARALDSLLAQSIDDWELVIIDDGSQDATARMVLPYLQERRIRGVHLLHHTGLGQVINDGLDRACAPLVAYLPSDDVWYRDPLRELIDCLEQHPAAALAFSGVRHHYKRAAAGKIAGYRLQLVQCMHRATSLRWTTREQLESDDLCRLFWSRLREQGMFVGTGSISCEWVDHPAQRHKMMREPEGGVNSFRQRYRVNQPLRFHTTTGNAIPSHVLDGDLPKKEWFDAPLRERLSNADGEIHTVVPGRPIGLHPHTVASLAAQGVHLHFYGDFTQGQWREWIDKARALAPRHLHLHANVEQARWVDEFSRYDAGWLLAFSSANGGELRRANWDDLNYPARMATLAAAGLPMIQRRNEGAIVATQALTRCLDMCVFYDEIGELAATLRAPERMQALRDNVWRARASFTFDYHVPALETFFRSVIERASRSRAPSRSAA